MYVRLHHIIEAQQFDRPTLAALFDLTRQMESLARSGGGATYPNRIMATLFYESSTRTRYTYDTAMLRLGGSVISTENARQFSSVSKGETLEDTIRILNGYADVIVMRHDESGAARRAATSLACRSSAQATGPGSTPPRPSSISTRSRKSWDALTIS